MAWVFGRVACSYLYEVDTIVKYTMAWVLFGCMACSGWVSLQLLIYYLESRTQGYFDK